MLDVGVTLEPERLGLVEKLQSSCPEQWSAAELAAYQAGMNPDVGGVPLKLVYGSDFAYREADAHLGVRYENVGLRPSFAKGGLSNVWGAAMMPFLDRDLGEWPFKLSALAPHYVAVLRFTGLAACHDGLEESFSLYTNHPTDLRPSQQCQQMLDTMARHREALARRGIRFGRSRLAVRGNLPMGNCDNSPPHPSPLSLGAGEGEDQISPISLPLPFRGGERWGEGPGGCVYCRLCMYGCPYGFIYTSADTVTQLQAMPGFSYQPCVVVTLVRESAQGVEISGYDKRTGEARTWQGDRAFIAAGPIATTCILLRSLGAYNEVAYLKDSQYFLLPLILLRRVCGATREWLHALSQVFLEIAEPGGQDTTAHIQVYSNNDLISQAVSKAFGPLRGPLGFLMRNFQERLLVAQGFLHSRHSSRIAACLRKDEATGKERLELRAELNPAARARVRKLVNRLCLQSRRIGAMPLPLMLKVAEPGRSFHSGGSFPMSAEPRGFQTDLLGRLPGWKRVHAVDSTIFPSIPATTITFSAMANAHRIGWEAAREE
jgi:ferredoxin